MNDLSALTSVAIILPLIVSIVGLLIFYLLIRAAVFHGMQDHSRWIDKRRGLS